MSVNDNIILLNLTMHHKGKRLSIGLSALAWPLFLLFDFLIFWTLAYLTKVIQETHRAY